MHQRLHIRRTNVEQLDATVDLLAQAGPVEIEERVIARNLANHVVRDARTFTKPREMKLLYFAQPAHVVHQVVGVAFSPYESHNYLLFGGACVVYEASTTPSMVRCGGVPKV